MTFESTATPEWYEQVAELWAAGKTCGEISAITGDNRNTISSRMWRRRDLFPIRYDERGRKPKPEVRVIDGNRRHYIGNGRWVDRVPYTTISGAVVSLPRVSILNGKEA
jgi:hypothetical protein